MGKAQANGTIYDPLKNPSTHKVSIQYSLYQMMLFEPSKPTETPFDFIFLA